MEPVKTVREAVQRLGGGEVVGNLTGTSRFAVHEWVKANKFAGRHYRVVGEAAATKGFYVPDDLFARLLVHPSALKEEHLTDDSPIPQQDAS